MDLDSCRNSFLPHICPEACCAAALDVLQNRVGAFLPSTQKRRPEQQHSSSKMLHLCVKGQAKIAWWIPSQALRAGTVPGLALRICATLSKYSCSSCDSTCLTGARTKLASWPSALAAAAAACSALCPGPALPARPTIGQSQILE